MLAKRELLASRFATIAQSSFAAPPHPKVLSMKSLTPTSRILLLLCGLLALGVSCSSEPEQTDEPPEVILIIDEDKDMGSAADMTAPEDMSSAPEDMGSTPEDLGQTEDMAPPEEDMPVDMGPPLPLAAVDVCDELGLERRPFLTEGVENVAGGIAGDFTLTTARGPWKLSDYWSGCDSYIFINHYPSDYADQVWASDVSKLFVSAPKNVHFFFGEYQNSWSPLTPSTGKPTEMRDKLDAALAAMNEQDREHWTNRVHVIRPGVRDMGNALGEFLRSRGNEVLFSVGIDRMQRFDSGGALFSVGRSGFVGDVRMASYIPRYYNFRAEQLAEIEAQQDVTEVTLFDGVEISQNDGIHEVTFPDAATMATFNTMEIDISAACGPTPQDCGEWDYEAYLQLCMNEACDERHEIALWITPYSRPGERRWIADATPFLPFFKDGGTHRVRFGMRWNMNKNLMNVRFRLRSIDGEPRPVAITPLFSERGGGDNFDATYNDRFQPFEFTPPAGTKKVELAMLMTGHGQAQGSNCAEWCNHVHTFEIGDDTWVKEHSSEASVLDLCAERASEGVVPGQYGNWAPGRAAWCPGQIVQPWRQDLTGSVTPGQPNTISYSASYRNGDPPGGRIRLSSYLVYYE